MDHWWAETRRRAAEAALRAPLQAVVRIEFVILIHRRRSRARDVHTVRSGQRLEGPDVLISRGRRPSAALAGYAFYYPNFAIKYNACLTMPFLKER